MGCASSYQMQVVDLDELEQATGLELHDTVFCYLLAYFRTGVI